MCWGSINDPNDSRGTYRNLTIPTVLLTGVRQLALDGEGWWAVLIDEAAYAWGTNSTGQLGNGNGNGPSLDHQKVARIQGLEAVAQIAAGTLHGCALLADSTVSCWGWNLSGQLGNGTFTQRLTPTPIPHLSGVVELALGEAHSCARLADATVKCWGANDVGQLGDGTTIGRPNPTTVEF